MKRYPNLGPVSMDDPVHEWRLDAYVLRESIERGLLDIVCTACGAVGLVGIDFYRNEGFRRPEFLMDWRCTGGFTDSVDLGEPEIATKAMGA